MQYFFQNRSNIRLDIILSHLGLHNKNEMCKLTRQFIDRKIAIDILYSININVIFSAISSKHANNFLHMPKLIII